MLTIQRKKSFEKLKQQRIKVLTRDTPMTAEEINENLDMIMTLLLTPKTMGEIEYVVDLPTVKREMLVFTQYITVLRKGIERVPTECKYYFVRIRNYKRCFLAIRKIMVRSRKEYFEAEEGVGMLRTKYKNLFLNLNKKYVRPKARQLFFFLDRSLPADMLFLEILIFQEKMRDPVFSEDPVNQMKNTEILEFIADVRHQCELTKNMVYGYVNTVAMIKNIFVDIESFYNKFEEFDLENKDYYNAVKKELGDENFDDRKGIEVNIIVQEMQAEEEEIKAEVMGKAGDVSVNITEILNELATPSAMTMATSELQNSDSSLDETHLMVPEDLGMFLI